MENVLFEVMIYQQIVGIPLDTKEKIRGILCLTITNLNSMTL